MITISEIAAEKIKQILKVENLPSHGLRITAGGGGCCGPQYEISLDEKAGDGDTVVEKDGAKLFVDKTTAQTLEGAELGFISDERGEGFMLSFPKGAPGAGSCGCGTDPNAGGGCAPGSDSGCGCG